MDSPADGAVVGSLAARSHLVDVGLGEEDTVSCPGCRARTDPVEGEDAGGRRRHRPVGCTVVVHCIVVVEEHCSAAAGEGEPRKENLGDTANAPEEDNPV